VFHPVQLQTAAAAPAPTASAQTMQAKSKEVVAATTAMTKVISGQTKEIYLEHHHHHHYHHIHHHHDLHGLQQHRPSQPPMDCVMTMECSDVTGPAPQTMTPVPVEGQAANYSMNASNSGSNHGSNGQNRGSTNAHTGGVNMETANIVAEKNKALNGNENGSGSGGGSGVYLDRLVQREAALNKFRQKRKERNFNKKVTLFQ
jgi:pseudo-response regulator 7